MGNNKKTVKCSFCMRLGHNRVSCEKLKILIENERSKHGSDHPDVKLYDSLNDRYSKKSSENANTVRHCKYCFIESHNVRTCKELANDFLALKKRNAQWRKCLLIIFREKGIGTGCILTSKHFKKFGNKTLTKGDKWILTSIDWNNITFDSTKNPDDYKVFKLVNLSNSSAQTMLSISQLMAVNESNPTISEMNWDVISPSKTLDYPVGWDTVSDKKYDERLVEIFKYLNKSDIQDLLSFSYLDKPYFILQYDDELLLEGMFYNSSLRRRNDDKTIY